MTIHRTTPPVSVVIPVFNGERTIRDCLDAVERQLDPGSEIIVVDDGGGDGSMELVRERRSPALRVINGRALGVAAAVNDGILAARHDVVCQIDQDVIVHDGWFEYVLPMLAPEGVAAVQGCFSESVSSRVIARCGALDLSARYAAIDGDTLDHVCTGNTAYKVDALRTIGLFDESLGYGDDNDLSYRLLAAGYRLQFCRAATATHAWPETLTSYARQQYGLGYGRLDVIAKHPRRTTGDAVSGAGMIAHAASMVAACLLLPVSWRAAAVIIALLALERVCSAGRTWHRFRDPAALALPALHVLRDLAWTCAIGMWSVRRLTGRGPAPCQSMGRRNGPAPADAIEPEALARVAAVIPALNERAALPTVLMEIRARWPTLQVVVVDDGSEDGTFETAVRLGCHAVRLPLRLGVGSAVRAGIRYARRLGYDTVVRIDADGQHAVEEIPRVLAPVLSGAADAAAGARPFVWRAPLLRPVTRGCLALGLMIVLRRRVRDPTSGFWAFGPRATRRLAAKHPTGYPEPELHMLLDRERLSIIEVPVSSRERIAGRTSLTTCRAGLALGRALLAMIVVPLRPSGDPRR